MVPPRLVQHAQVVLDRHTFERAKRGDTGIVDPHVEAVERGDRDFGELLHVACVADVGAHRDRIAAFGGELLQRFVTARGQHEVPTLRGEAQRDAAAEAAGGAGDHDGTVGHDTFSE